MQGDDVEELFRATGAVLDGHFRLTSGRHSNIYLEKFRVLEAPLYAEKLCTRIADYFRPHGVDVVAGPTTGGIIISYEVARQLGVHGIFAERNSEGSGRRHFGRGFQLRADQRVLVVDDVLTTGGSIREVLAAVRQVGAQPIGVGVLVDRSGGKATFDGLPFYACWQPVVPSYAPEECPLCEQGIPLTET